MKAEASIVQRISELQKEGMWYDKRLPKVCEAPKARTHWDYLLEEMSWLATDFATERKWKRTTARRVRLYTNNINLCYIYGLDLSNTTNWIFRRNGGKLPKMIY